jgi:hypothetical protein
LKNGELKEEWRGVYDLLEGDAIPESLIRFWDSAFPEAHTRTGGLTARVHSNRLIPTVSPTKAMAHRLDIELTVRRISGNY